MVLPFSPEPREELLHVTNTSDVPVLVCVAPPVCGTVIISVFPEVLRLEPHETQHITFRFMLRGLTSSFVDEAKRGVALCLYCELGAA